MRNGASTAGSALLDARRPAVSSVFFLARGGLRRLSGSGAGFLGYAPEDLFWRDILELVHEEDLPAVEAVISRIKQTPGACERTGARLRDASGAWRPVEVTLHNVREVPGDVGLVMAGVSDLAESARQAGRGRRRSERA